MNSHLPSATPGREPHLTLETSVSKAFLSQALDIAFDHDYYFDPILRRRIDARCHDYVAERLGDLDGFHTESNLGRKAHFHPRQVLVGGIQPNLILGLLLGAEFIPNAGGDADISPACWADKPVADLPEPDSLLEHPFIRRFDGRILDLMADGELEPIPPFFWDGSGRAAVHGALTTAQKFLGEEVFLELLTEPDRVRAVMDWITGANIVLVRHFAALAGIKITELHVGECSSCMVGPAEWERFVGPTLERMAELAPIRLHSCGASNHLLEPLRRLPAVRTLDLGGETSLALTRDMFGRDFPVSVAPPVKLLAGGSFDALWQWTEQVMADNQMGRLVILYHLEPQYSLPMLRQWHARLGNLI